MFKNKNNNNNNHDHDHNHNHNHNHNELLEKVEYIVVYKYITAESELHERVSKLKYIYMFIVCAGRGGGRDSR